MSLPELDAPPFAEPWHAQVFALAVALNEAGHLPWTDWAERFGILRAKGAADASDYFDHWAETLTALMVERGIASLEEISALTASWARAAAATPHGVPLQLENDPERSVV